MSSPLQVTFMATVVSARGDPGQDRWQLFKKYHETIYDRELQKALPPYQPILSEHADVINRLHHEVGFWLQFQGESTGANSVGLQVGQVRQLALEFQGPSGKGFEGKELDDLADTIMEAARSRLVFLTSRFEGELAFEVRGLQEYMAAECLMTGTFEQIIARLREIAVSPYWRNVLLFAAGKCFLDAQSRHYQDHLRLICEDVNDTCDKTMQTLRLGSELSLSILESGAPANNPNYIRHLSRLALDLLAQPDVRGVEERGAGFASRLAAVYRDSASALYREALETRVGQADVCRTLGAWPLLARLADREVSWARELAETRWPVGEQNQLRIFSADFEWADSEWLWNQLFALIPKVTPFDLGDVIKPREEDGAAADVYARPSSNPPRWYSAAKDSVFYTFPPNSVAFIPDLLDDSISLHFCGLFGEFASDEHRLANLHEMPVGHPEWTPFCESHVFYRNPGAKALATVLRSCVARGLKPGARFASSFANSRLPWPIAACLATAQSSDQLAELAMLAERGQLGDTREWRAAENRWEERGVRVSDLLAVQPSRGPFDASIATTGIPTLGRWNLGMTIRSYQRSELTCLLGLMEDERLVWLRENMIWILLRTIEQCRHAQESDFKRLAEIVRRVDPAALHFLGLGLSPLSNPGPGHLEFFNACGLAPAFSLQLLRPDLQTSDTWGKYWEEALIRNPHHLGLLRLLGRYVALGKIVNGIPQGLLAPERYHDRRIGFSAVLIRLNCPSLTPSEAEALAGWAARYLDPPTEQGAADLLFTTLERHFVRVPTNEAFLVALRENLPSSIELGVARCDRLLRRIVKRRPSGLQKPGNLSELGLPNIRASAT
jgi:hypothetical protein